MELRAHYLHELDELQQQLIRLGKLVEQAITRSLWAVFNQDAAAARRVLDGDHEIDEFRYRLEEQALLLIARQQPFAGDLRTISAVIDIAGELERIGDYAEGLGKIVLRSQELAPVEPPTSLTEMAQATREMFRDAMAAVPEPDPEAGHRLEHADERVDSLYQTTLEALIRTMQEHPQQIERALYLIWAAHNLERIADRTVNIAERIAFAAGKPQKVRG